MSSGVELVGSRPLSRDTNIYLTLASSCLASSLHTFENFLPTTTASEINSSTASSLKSAASEILSKGSAMIYYSVDPQFGALLLSLYARNDRAGSLFSGDPFATSYGSFSSSLGSDLVSYTHSTLLQILEIGQQYACFLSQGESKHEHIVICIAYILASPLCIYIVLLN